MTHRPLSGTFKSFLILSGSSMSYMDAKVMGYKYPLYGRTTSQIHLRPFNFGKVLGFLGPDNPNDAALYFGNLGGTPKYLSLVDKEEDAYSNISRLFLQADALLFEETESILKQEVRETAVYNSILKALAS